MATVKITPDVINSVVAKVQGLYEVDRAKLAELDYPTASKEYGEEMYSLLLSMDKQKQIRELMGDLAPPIVGNVAVRVVPFDVNAKWCANMYVTLPAEAISLPAKSVLAAAPGVHKIVWDGHGLTVHLAEDWSALAAPKSKAFIEKVVDMANKHHAIAVAATTASDTMRTFLGQHKTMQQAMKAFGPAMKAYIDPWLQQALDRPSPKRIATPKVAKEKVEVNIAKLVTKATTNQLNIN